MVQSYTDWRPITPSDTVDLPKLTRAIYVGGAGDVAAVLSNGDMPGAFKAVPVGWLPITVRRINATGTTATNLMALYQV
jgi:hypothetical protein